MKAPDTDQATRLARGRQLKTMRTAAGLSQSQLATSMSAHYSISRYETGARDASNMTLGMASRLAAALGMDVDTFNRTLLDIPAWPTLPARRHETLKRRLRRLGRTQAWLAEQTGLAPLQVSRYATGATDLTQLSLTRATQIAQALQANLADLAQWDELALLIAEGNKNSQDKDFKQAKRRLAELKGSNQC